MQNNEYLIALMVAVVSGSVYYGLFRLPVWAFSKLLPWAPVPVVLAVLIDVLMGAAALTLYFSIWQGPVTEPGSHQAGVGVGLAVAVVIACALNTAKALADYKRKRSKVARKSQRSEARPPSHQSTKKPIRDDYRLGPVAWGRQELNAAGALGPDTPASPSSMAETASQAGMASAKSSSEVPFSVSPRASAAGAQDAEEGFVEALLDDRHTPHTGEAVHIEVRNGDPGMETTTSQLVGVAEALRSVEYDPERAYMGRVASALRDCTGTPLWADLRAYLDAVGLCHREAASASGSLRIGYLTALHSHLAERFGPSSVANMDPSKREAINWLAAKHRGSGRELARKIVALVPDSAYAAAERNMEHEFQTLRDFEDSVHDALDELVRTAAKVQHPGSPTLELDDDSNNDLEDKALEGVLRSLCTNPRRFVEPGLSALVSLEFDMLVADRRMTKASAKVRAAQAKYDDALTQAAARAQVTTEESQQASSARGTVTSQDRAGVLHLGDIVGQASVKREFQKTISAAQFSQARRSQGLPEIGMAFHAAFVGSPGTGKTTVARLYAQKLKDLGLLRKGHLIEATRSDLVAGFVGQTAGKTMGQLEKARGGVLFIDEAYSLLQGKDDTFGRESIDVIVKYMEDFRDDLVVVVAGYQNEMRDFLAANPGLEGRFSVTIPFEDYSDEELGQILDGMCSKSGMGLGQEARASALRAVLRGRRSRQFANARAVRKVFEEGIKRLGMRVGAASTPELLTTFAPSDFEEVDSDAGFADVSGGRPIPPLERLNQLVGLKLAKAEVAGLAALVQVTRARRGASSLPDINLHMVFSGNPGTGKTTVAALLGALLHDMELLASGHVVSVLRNNLVAEYSGQTATKTREVFEKSLGGILFIDEAYSLARGPSDSFGQEAIDELLALMENNRGKCAVVVAGYPQQMKDLLNSNPGLRSRFSRWVTFEDYSQAELLDILVEMVKRDGFALSEDASTQLPSVIGEWRRAPGFANARTVRQRYEDAQQCQAQRMLREKKLQDLVALRTLELADFTS